MTPCRRALCSLALLAGFVPAASFAAGYPERTVTIIVPFSPGGGVDATARLLAEKLSASLHQSVIVDNRPGASGMVGVFDVVKAPADGYTLLLASAGETAINPYIYKGRMKYEPQKDLAPVSGVVSVPNVMVVNSGLPVKNVAELIAYGKANPGKLSYGTGGVGNLSHLNGELLQSMAGIKMQHVPYKGSSGYLVDMASGIVNIAFVNYGVAAPFIKGGRVKALAVTSPKRADFAASIPAIGETVPGYGLENWYGLFAPAATPPAIVAQVNAAVQAALRDPALIKQLQDQGSEPVPSTPAQFRDFVKAQSSMFQQIVESAKIVAE